MTLAITLNIILATIVLAAIFGLLAAAIGHSRDITAVTTASRRTAPSNGAPAAPAPALALVLV